MSLSAGFMGIERASIWTTQTILGPRWRAFGATSTIGSMAWPTINQAFLIPFVTPGPITVTRLFFLSGTTPGTANYDLGIYTESFTLVTSLGATASVNTTQAFLPSTALTTAVTLPRGRYFLAMSAAATSITVTAGNPALQAPRYMGMQTMASAYPLPPTITPASMGSTSYVPTLGFLTDPNPTTAII